MVRNGCRDGCFHVGESRFVAAGAWRCLSESTTSTVGVAARRQQRQLSSLAPSHDLVIGFWGDGWTIPRHRQLAGTPRLPTLPKPPSLLQPLALRRRPLCLDHCFVLSANLLALLLPLLLNLGEMIGNHLVPRLLLPHQLGLLGHNDGVFVRPTLSFDASSLGSCLLRCCARVLLLDPCPVGLGFGPGPCRLFWVARAEEVGEADGAVARRRTGPLKHLGQLPRAGAWVKRPDVLEHGADLGEREARRQIVP
mmetsp:Transcript_29492/g.77320  ORF Transcript_29492/g.77320 Transcript_29492/m.77320 type:complete len:252 (-) Transcript_29492:230-985(-)